ncbi:PIN domain-containing protein [Leucothrix mucor]|uniref:PIN domain-containing protein n=1 Tax=Leucothrix mucor TaxID=45248 RepID=UPI0003B3C6B4|nr:PIN domain-containing protein [Leucothrix mucor]
MNIYLDNCCLNRPFDDQSYPRIHLEAEAVKTILSLCEQDGWALLTSDVLSYEVQKITAPDKRQYLELILSSAQLNIRLQPSFRERARYFEQSGIKAFDALHLACAEAHADVFLTTDDRLLKKIKQLPDVKLTASNPLAWVQEIL